MKYSITLFSCANEAECGFRGFLFSKVACLVMHMPFLCFLPCPCLQPSGALNGQLGLIRLPDSEPWPSSAQQEQPWPLIRGAKLFGSKCFLLAPLETTFHTLETHDGRLFWGFSPQFFSASLSADVSSQFLRQLR